MTELGGRKKTGEEGGGVGGDREKGSKTVERRPKFISRLIILATTL